MKLNIELDLERGDGAVRWSGATWKFIRRAMTSLVAVAAILWSGWPLH